MMQRLIACALAIAAIVHGTLALASDEVGLLELAGQIAAGDAPIVLDVRSPDEYAAGHIPGAVSLPLPAFPGIIAELKGDKAKPVVVYCETGRRAGIAKAALLGAGFSDVRLLRGHMSGWRETGLNTSN